jgi:hypothetical protein
MSLESEREIPQSEIALAYEWNCRLFSMPPELLIFPSTGWLCRESDPSNRDGVAQMDAWATALCFLTIWIKVVPSLLASQSVGPVEKIQFRIREMKILFLWAGKQQLRGWFGFDCFVRRRLLWYGGWFLLLYSWSYSNAILRYFKLTGVGLSGTEIIGIKLTYAAE